MIDTFLLFPSLEAIPEMFRNRAKVRPDKTYVIDPRDLDKTDLAMLLHAADPAREVHKSPHSKNYFLGCR